MAARRMKGVVRPQAKPTRRKPRVERKREGGGVGGGGESIYYCSFLKLSLVIRIVSISYLQVVFRSCRFVFITFDTHRKI